MFNKSLLNCVKSHTHAETKDDDDTHGKVFHENERCTIKSVMNGYKNSVWLDRMEAYRTMALVAHTFQLYVKIINTLKFHSPKLMQSN